MYSSSQPSLIDQLIQTFSKLPGLGPRSARRIVLHLLSKPDNVMTPLMQQLQLVKDHIQTCRICGNLDVNDVCHICASDKRDKHVICVVEDVADLWAIERGHYFQGTYHVLGGVLSAIDGISPDDLGIPTLQQRVADDEVKEIIMALNSTADGQITAHYISDQLQPTGVRITRLAQGIPMGADLDYLDDGTLGAALQSRLSI